MHIASTNGDYFGSEELAEKIWQGGECAETAALIAELLILALADGALETLASETKYRLSESDIGEIRYVLSPHPADSL